METIDYTIAIKNFLKAHPLGTLATLSQENTPELSVLYFFCDDAFNCYFVTKTATRKFENILKNPQISLLAYDDESLTTVELSGTVTVLTRTEEVLSTITEFQKIATTRHLDYWVPPVAQIDGAHYVTCKLSPLKIHFKQFSKKIDGTADVQSFTLDPQAI